MLVAAVVCSSNSKQAEQMYSSVFYCESFLCPVGTLAEAMEEGGVQPDSWLVSSSVQPLFRSQLSPSADLVVAVFLTFTGRQTINA